MIKTITLRPSRIDCSSIPGTMKGIIMSVKGVHLVTVRYKDRALDITFNDAETSVEQIIKAVGDEMGLALNQEVFGSSIDKNVVKRYPM